MSHGIIKLLVASAAALVCAVAPGAAAEKYGVIDSKGAWVIPPEYQNILYLGDGLYLVARFEPGSLWYPNQASLLDSSGKPFPITLPAGFTIAGILPSGTAPVANRSQLLLRVRKDGHFGVCDIDGKVIIEPLYDNIKTYNEGSFTAIDETAHNTIFISRDGHVTGKVAEHDYDFSSNEFHEGVVLGECAKRLYTGAPGGVLSLYKFFKPDGEPLPLPDLCWASEFSEGYAGVGVCDKGRRLLYSALMNKKGELLANRKFSCVGSFHSGQAIADVGTVEKHQYGVVDHWGDFVIPPQYLQLKINDDSTYIATTSEGDSLIDRRGEVLARYKEKVELFPSDTPLLQCSVRSRNPCPNDIGYAAYTDRAGNIFTQTHWPDTTVVAPAWTMESGRGWWGLRSSKGWLTERTFDGFEQLPEGRWIARYESRTFDVHDWEMNLDRAAEWHKLLQQQDLIGMPRAKIIELLGDTEHGSNWLRYDISPRAICGNAATGILLDFQNDRLKRWRISSLMSRMDYELSDAREWFSDNVVYSCQTNSYVLKYANAARTSAGAAK